MNKIYLIGSLRNEKVPILGNKIRELGFDVFDDWYGAGERADDSWQAYEKLRGRRFDDALKGHAAQHVFNFDKKHLDAADIAILLLPAGKSGHLELGYHLGQKKPGYIVMESEPERFDVMYNFCSGVFFNEESLFEALLHPTHLSSPVSAGDF